MATEAAGGRVHVRRLRLRNYRSVRECDVALQPGVTFLVGPNGCGKSNILDGLRLISDALSGSLGEAVNGRGGVGELIHHGIPRSSTLTVEVVFCSPGASGSYRLALGPTDFAFGAVEERCAITDAEGVPHEFTVTDGTVVSSDPVLPLPSADRLYLAVAVSLPAFGPVYDALSTMSFYNLSPAAMRGLRKPDPGRLLARDGGNIATAIQVMAREEPADKDIVEQYLRVIVPDIVGVDARQLSSQLELDFRLASPGELRHFSPDAMSDGTLRALGVLVAGFQPGRHSVRSLVGVEKPEAALHPTAGAVLRDAMSEASERRQIVLTTHSAELLDDREIDPDSILAVEAIDGASVVGPPEPVGLGTIREGLFTAGELLRANQLFPAKG